MEYRSPVCRARICRKSPLIFQHPSFILARRNNRHHFRVSSRMMPMPPGYTKVFGFAPTWCTKKALRKRKAFFIMIAALCECFRFAADFNPSQRLFLFCRRVGEKFIHSPGDATIAANGSGGPFLLPCTAAICYTKEKNRRGGTADDPHCNRRG